MKYIYTVFIYFFFFTKFSLLNATLFSISIDIEPRLSSIKVLTDTLPPFENLRTECSRIAKELEAEKIKVALLKAKIREHEGGSSSPFPEPKVVPDPNGIPVGLIDNYEVALNNSKAKAADLENRNRGLRNELVDLKYKNRRLENENNQLKKDKRKLENEIDRLETKIDSLETIVRNQRDEINALNETIRLQKIKIDKLEGHVKLLEGDYLYMINQFNQNSTQLYVIYDFPRSKKDEDNYVLLKGLPNMPRLKIKKIDGFYIDIQLFIPDNVPVYHLDLKIKDKKTGSSISIPLELDIKIGTRSSQKGYYLFTGKERFDQGLRDPTKFGNLFKRKESFFEKNKTYTYEITHDLGNGLPFPKGTFQLD